MNLPVAQTIPGGGAVGFVVCMLLSSTAMRLKVMQAGLWTKSDVYINRLVGVPSIDAHAAVRENQRDRGMAREGALQTPMARKRGLTTKMHQASTLEGWGRT